jgi:hypothetical protein
MRLKLGTPRETAFGEPAFLATAVLIEQGAEPVPETSRFIKTDIVGRFQHQRQTRRGFKSFLISLKQLRIQESLKLGRNGGFVAGDVIHDAATLGPNLQFVNWA